MNPGEDRYLLVVDDQPAICELLAEVFIAEGYRVETALNGNQAIRAIRARTPGLIFMDINMPGKNGLETLKEVQGLISGVPVIMITAYGELEDVMDARKRGLIQYYITKPFDVVSLIQLVRRLVAPAPGMEKDCQPVGRTAFWPALAEIDNGAASKQAMVSYEEETESNKLRSGAVRPG